MAFLLFIFPDFSGNYAGRINDAVVSLVHVDIAAAWINQGLIPATRCGAIARCEVG
jgi:hypothetical protein